MARVVAALKTGQIPVTFHFSANSQAPKRPLVVITHHFGGNEQTSRRHVALLNELGFDCATFLFSRVNPFSRQTPTKRFFSLSLSQRWKSEIEQVLEQVPSREKILYSFSGPAASALELIASHVAQNRFDVVGFICDSGPFIDARVCTRNMIEQLYKVTSALKRETVLNFMMLMWGLDHDRKLLKATTALAKKAPGFAILSFRGTLDTIVPVDKIAAVFDHQGFINLTVANLETGHLTGLKEMPAPYKRVLGPFLKPWTLH